MERLFGTDGIRAKVGTYPLTEEMVHKIGIALGAYVLGLNVHKRKRQKVAIIRDTRDSGVMFEDALSKGITSTGVDVLKLGIMPTSALAHLIKEERYDLGVVISASHNAITDNGLKFFSHRGYKLFNNEEREIEKILFEQVTPSTENQFLKSEENQGKIREEDKKKEYANFLKQIVGDCDVSKYKVVIDSAYGSASVVAPNLFKEITKEVISLNDALDPTAINKDCGALHPEVVSKAVVENSADCGFSFDGDADRVIVCDERGKVLDGDFLLAIIGNYFIKKGLLRKNSIVATHMSNLGLDMCVSQWGGKLLKTEVGDRFVLEKMLSSKINLGGEQSGHIIPLDYATAGDGILTALLIMKIMCEEDKPLSVLARCMYKFPQILVNILVENRKPIEELPKLSKIIAKHEQKLGSSGRVYVRYSGTEGNKLRIMIEGQDQLQIKEIAEAIANIAKEELGCLS